MEKLRRSSTEQPTEEQSWLEEQYKKRETLDVMGQEVKVLDIVPREQKHETPVVIAPGYGTASPAHIKTNILEMVRLGRRTLFIDEPRGITHNFNTEDTRGIQDYFLNQISALIGTMDAKGIQKVDIVGNSEGGIYTIIAASLYPERFENIVLCNTAGMIGEDTSLKLIYRFATDGLRSAIDMQKRKGSMSAGAKSQMKDGVAGFNKYVVSNPKASFEEIQSMAGTQIRSIVKDVKSKGVGISIIHTVDDGVFPVDRVMKETSRQSPTEELIVDGFYTIGGGHTEFSINPEQYTMVADSALTALEEKKSKQNTSA